MRFKRFSLWCAAIVTLSLAGFSAPVLAEEGPVRGDRDLRVLQVVRLQPQADAEILVPNFRAIVREDGSVTLTGSGRARVGAPTSGFDFEVDILAGTYTTRRLDPREIEELVPLQEAMGFNRTLSEPGDEGDAPLEKVSPGTWSGRVRVQTKDPAFIVLAETTVQLTWTVASNGTVAWKSYSDGCWAANPSSLGTHWFVTSCAAGGGPWYASGNRVCNDNSGSYHNWDFLNASQRTDSSHYAWLCGRNDAFFDYNWSYSDSGEAALLIFGSVVTN